eukprot:TRINITY_DN7319_c0_g1_i2.p1 TRINITY_DN7319_c0_g1~~TRINITY_DN7319_c0_g1_i2.p1  ORF type:complete len:145 (+),score=19.19 TRINITY_DN7319_c0_g1_i2:511-945(+)
MHANLSDDNFNLTAHNLSSDERFLAWISRNIIDISTGNNMPTIIETHPILNNTMMFTITAHPTAMPIPPPFGMGSDFTAHEQAVIYAHAKAARIVKTEIHRRMPILFNHQTFRHNGASFTTSSTPLIQHAHIFTGILVSEETGI